MSAFCFLFPKFYQKARVLFVGLFCLLACFLLDCTLYSAHAGLNSTIVKSKLFLVAPWGSQCSDGDSPCGLGKHWGPLGSEFLVLTPHLCPGTALFLKPCLWFLRPDPRTCHPAGPVLQRRSYRDGTCCVTKHLLDDQYSRCFSLLPYRLWAIVDKVASKLCCWTCTWACEAGRLSTSSFPRWHKLYPVIVFVGRGHTCVDRCIINIAQLRLRMPGMICKLFWMNTQPVFKVHET